jgi:hypothetical protein
MHGYGNPDLYQMILDLIQITTIQLPQKNCKVSKIIMGLAFQFVGIIKVLISDDPNAICFH